MSLLKLIFFITCVLLKAYGFGPGVLHGRWAFRFVSALISVRIPTINYTQTDPYRYYSMGPGRYSFYRNNLTSSSKGQSDGFQFSLFAQLSFKVTFSL